MGLKFLNSKLQMLCVINCKKINKCIGNQQCNRHMYFPGQHYSFQGFFQTFPCLRSFSRLFKALKISTLNSRTFHTFPGSVRTPLKTGNDVADLISWGSLFQTEAAATTKARSPIAERQVAGMACEDDAAECRRLRPGTSTTRLTSADR